MIEFTLAPYIGSLPITFEMSPADVEKVVGPATSIRTMASGKREERRRTFIVRYLEEDNKVVEITFLPAAILMYQGQNLLKTDDVIGFLSKRDMPFEHVGFVIFFQLGLMVTGFHDNDDSQKAMTVVRKGMLDRLKGRAIPLES